LLAALAAAAAIVTSALLGSVGESGRSIFDVIVASTLLLALLSLCALDARNWRSERRCRDDGARRRRCEALQQELDALRRAAEPKEAEADDEVPEEAGEVGTVLREDSLEAPPGGWRLLDCGPGALLEVLGALDGASLVRTECVSRWPLALGSVSGPPLAGIWRFAHVCALGGRPPASMARPPAATAAIGRSHRLDLGGPWKQWWLWRQRLLSEPDEQRREISLRIASPLLSALVLRGRAAGASTAAMELQALKPNEAWPENLLGQLQARWGRDSCQLADRRLAPLIRRWHCHALLAGEAGFHLDHVQMFASFSFCFSAATGQPRFYLGLSMHSASSESWKADIFECKVPAKASLPWHSAATEIARIIAEGLPISSSLCSATEVLRLDFRGRGPGRPATARPARLELEHLTSPAALSVVQSEVLGARLPAASRCCEALEWLLAACCPKPFSEEPQLLAEMAPQLAEHVSSQR
ncbi:unnamed protein product, partial [Polarella glacialis]